MMCSLFVGPDYLPAFSHNYADPDSGSCAVCSAFFPNSQSKLHSVVFSYGSRHGSLMEASGLRTFRSGSHLLFSETIFDEDKIWKYRHLFDQGRVEYSYELLEDKQQEKKQPWFMVGRTQVPWLYSSRGTSLGSPVIHSLHWLGVSRW